MKVREKDRKSSGFLIALGVWIMITACQFGLGVLTDPGPGFLPFLGGALLVLLSVIVFLQAPKPDPQRAGEEVRIGNWKILLMTVCFVFYAIFFRKLGFVLATFLLMTILFQIVERKSWLRSIFISALTIAAAYFIFVVWLKVQLPKGMMPV